MGLTFEEPEPSRLLCFGTIGDNSSGFLHTFIPYSSLYVTLLWPSSMYPIHLGFPVGSLPESRACAVSQAWLGLQKMPVVTFASAW